MQSVGRALAPARAAAARVALALALAAGAAVLLINEAGYRRSTEAQLSSQASQQARSAVERLLRQMLDAETGSRGYLLTGDARYLAPYDDARAALDTTLTQLSALLAPWPEDTALVIQLGQHVQRKVSEMDLSVRMRQQGRDEGWRFVVSTDVGQQQMEAIRDQAARLLANATERIASGEAAMRAAMRAARFGVAGVTLAALLAFWLYLRQSRALRRADERQQAALQRERDRLERQVRERTATLTELATHLQQVREDERGRLARELHDELGALLTAAKLDLARARQRLELAAATGDGNAEAAADPQLRACLDGVQERLAEVVALKRRIVEDLRPSALSHLGLTASLDILAREFGQRSGISVHTTLEPVDVGEALQLTAYRLVQEALTNIGKHAQARHVAVRLAAQPHHLEVEIRDDGRGFDPDAVGPGSHGLAGMRHRVEALGGRLGVQSAPGAGTTLRAVLPLG